MLSNEMKKIASNQQPETADVQRMEIKAFEANELHQLDVDTFEIEDLNDTVLAAADCSTSTCSTSSTSTSCCTAS